MLVRLWLTGGHWSQLLEEFGFLFPSYSLLLCLLAQVQLEAKRSMEILDDRMVDGFQALLMTPKPMLRTFDHVFQ